MLQITCAGTPRQIGLAHGGQGADLVRGSVDFYSKYFVETSKMDWETACSTAAKFLPFLDRAVPHLVEEMRGIADAAGVSFHSVLALNARTEIAMGLMNDGCTSVAWCSDKFSVAGQNWDWMDAQKERLVILHISPSKSKPAISTVTEAGIVAKIGLNSEGVGVFLNAIFARGVDFDALPVHVALRSALESRSRAEAAAFLESHRVAAAAHILVADDGATSLEFSAGGCMTRADTGGGGGYLGHTNHFLREHEVQDLIRMEDSVPRMARVSALLAEAEEELRRDMDAGAVLSAATMLERILRDEHGFPVSINRKSSAGNPASTLFTIVVDLRAKTATVTLGRPTEPEGTCVLNPSEAWPELGTLG